MSLAVRIEDPSGLAVLSWLPRVVLARSRRYRGIQSRHHAFEASLRLFDLPLGRPESSTGLAGGFVALS